MIGTSAFLESIVATRPPLHRWRCPYRGAGGNMLDAMKRLGLEGRIHLEWVSAKLGDRSSRKRSSSSSSRSGRGTQVRFGQNRRERGSLGYIGRRCVWIAAVRFLFSRGIYIITHAPTPRPAHIFSMILYSILSACHSLLITFASNCFYPHHNGMRIRTM